MAANVLVHGTGALNIKVSRIPGVTQHNMANGIFAHSGTGKEQDQYVMQNYQTTFTRTDGRWPSNLILEHDEGCRCIGTPGFQSLYVGGEAKQDGFEGSHVNAEGKETVAWECAPGCAVASLDATETGGASRFYKQVGGQK